MNDSKAMLRFRESFRGFNKDDVNSYIEQVNMHFSRKEADYKKQIAELSAKGITPIQKNITEITASNTNDVIEKLQNELSVKTNENAILKTEIEKYKSAEMQLGESNEKSKLYDSMSAQVGNILIVANSNADKIISDAKAEAEIIRQSSETEALIIKKNTVAQMDEMIIALEIKLKAVYENYLSDYAGVVSEAQMRFSELTAVMTERSEKLRTSAEKLSRDVEYQIDSDYRRLEKKN